MENHVGDKVLRAKCLSHVHRTTYVMRSKQHMSKTQKESVYF
jgi:hypothetical protein